VKRLPSVVINAVRAEDFDMYVVLALALVLIGVDIWNSNWTLALFAAVLGTFAVTLVRLRRHVGELHSGTVGIGSVFLHETPIEAVEELEGATDVLLMGVSLDRTLRNAYVPIEKFLQRGGRLRVLLVNPENEWAVKTADRRAYFEQGYEQRKDHIDDSIGSFRQLLERTNGDVELRVTDDPLTFGATMIDGELDSRHTRIVIQHYSYKKREAREPNPVFVLYPRDAEWFAEFREEIENLWSDGVAI
jgi:Domain of unknown function (DUF5919)